MTPTLTTRGPWRKNKRMACDIDDPTGLVGEEPNIVTLVMDYVEFHINCPKLTALTDPHIQIGPQTWIFPEPGSRLDEDNLHGPKAAHFFPMERGGGHYLKRMMIR
ncbi:MULTISPECIES: hypothetical protein [Streptosporangium]|uniref:Uncharacterized protein n=1 Tax=Streptosporangium brasiliense TaxID=47480 RepID=A0ABT9R7Z0_9ACTN|nr:hypothetical protein [Streptosporangium brasiliense]MDP9864515.1 hypothetical protein [Streptosporangium brasiliense]